MAKKIIKQDENDRPMLEASTVMSFPQSPANKAEDYLKAYSGYPYTAISSIAQEVSSIELKLFKVKFVGKDGKVETEPVHQHPVLSFLDYINDFTTFYDLVEGTQVYEELVGEAFWVILRENGEKGEPIEAWLVRPDWMKIVPDEDDVIKEYIYDPGGVNTDKVRFPASNVIQFKYFNPTNPYRGRGSVQAGAMPIDIHTFSQDWNRNFFFNSAIPSLILTTEKKMNRQAIERFMTKWEQTYGGRAKSNKVAFLGGGFKVDKAMMSAKDMDFTEQQRMMRDDILAVFKVPKTILGLTDDVNRANAEATTRAFMQRVITPRMRKLVGALNEFLLPMFEGTENMFLDFVDPTPEDVEAKLKMYENARRYTWLTPNEIRILENLEPIESDVADDLFAPLGGSTSPIPTDQNGEDEEDENAGEETENEETGDEEREDEDKNKRIASAVQIRKRLEEKMKKTHKHMVPIPAKKMKQIKKEQIEKDLKKDLIKVIGPMLKDIKSKTEKRTEKQIEDAEKQRELLGRPIMSEKDKEKYWRQFIGRVDDYEEEIMDVSIRLFTEQEQLFLERLDAVKYWKMEVRKGRADSVLISVEDMAKTWIPIFTQLMKEIVREQGNHTLDFLGIGGDLVLTTERAVKFLREEAVDMIKEINKTTRSKLKDTLAEGFREGESIDNLRKRVTNVFKDATRNRARTIARTESIRASNFATNEAFMQSDIVEGREWLTALDERVRPDHAAAHGQAVKKNEPYRVGGEDLMYPGDPNGSSWNTINCRCVELPIILGSAGLKPPTKK